MTHEPGDGIGTEAGRVLDAGHASRVYPAAVAEAGTSGGVRWRHATGRLTYDADAPAASADTIFDLASLTKVVATTTIAMRLVERGRVDVDRPLHALMPGWDAGDRRAVRLRDLLEHCSGLPAWAPLFESCGGREAFAIAIASIPLHYAPRTQSVYSDLGFILLGFAIEDAGGAPLDEQFQPIAKALEPGGGDALLFGPPRTWRSRIAPTRIDPWRGRLLVGEVDDANAAALGGVAAHAGLFGTAGAVGAFARRMLLAMRPGPRTGAPLVRPSVLQQFLAKSAVPGSSRALGWDTMLATSSCGTRMSPSAIGHTGYAGTSVWIDPARDFYAVLLTNRVYPDGGSADAIREVRRAFHDALAAELPSWR
jgi:serine-type D-Ala-D-Ala carboxypeptidase